MIKSLIPLQCSVRTCVIYYPYCYIMLVQGDMFIGHSDSIVQNIYFTINIQRLRYWEQQYVQKHMCSSQLRIFDHFECDFSKSISWSPNLCLYIFTNTKHISIILFAIFYIFKMFLQEFYLIQYLKDTIYPIPVSKKMYSIQIFNSSLAHFLCIVIPFKSTGHAPFNLNNFGMNYNICRWNLPKNTRSDNRVDAVLIPIFAVERQQK